MRLLIGTLLFILAVFVAPALASMAWWKLQGGHPTSWREADWSSARTLPDPATSPEPAIYVLAARTGGLKGALSLHSWIVLKPEGASRYDRYDKVGWGSPVRRNAYPADARWYSNAPFMVHAVTGEQAAKLIPAVQAAIDAYPYAMPGGYRIWPGPNSNSFVAHVLANVPELGARMPPNATGRDFAPGLFSASWSPVTYDLHVTFGGYAGFSIGLSSGLELHFLGLVAGIDVLHPAIKVPAFGTLSLEWNTAGTDDYRQQAGSALSDTDG